MKSVQATLKDINEELRSVVHSLAGTPSGFSVLVYLWFSEAHRCARDNLANPQEFLAPVDNSRFFSGFL
jgi:hypothetical protein